MGMTGEQAYVLAKKLIEAGGGGGGTVNAYTKTQTDNLLIQKVDKEAGKGLFSGSYKDLSDTPTIPSKTSELQNDSVYQTAEQVNSAVNELLAENLIDSITYQSYNVLDLKDVAETTKNGVTMTVLDEVITLNGTATANTDLNLSSNYLDDGTYTFAYEILEGSFDGKIKYGYQSSAYVDILTTGKTVAITSHNRTKIRVDIGTVCDNLKIHLWAVAGEEYKDWQTYGEWTEKELKKNIKIPRLDEVEKHAFDSNVHISAIEKEYLSSVVNTDTTFDEEIEDTVSKTFDNSNGQCLRFAYISDTHTYPNYDEEDSSTKQYKAEIEHIKAVNDSIPFDFLLHCGDFVNTQWLWKEHTTTDRDYQKLVHDCCNELCNSGIKNIFTTMGNHDGGFIPNESGTGTEYSSFKANFRATQQQNTNSVKVVRYGINPYYYIDYENLKLRCLFIATDIDSLTSDYKGIDYNEALWLKNTLASLPDDYNVLMFGHIPLNRWYTKNSGAGSTQAFIDICNGFCNHTTVDLSGDKLDCDFTGKSGKILAYICGHYHGDSIVLPYDEHSVLQFPEVTIASGSYLGTGVITTGDWYDLADAPSDRTYGTINQDAWDSVVYNKTENKIYFTRFGAGNDRVLELS